MCVLICELTPFADVSTAGASKLPKPGHHKAPSETHVFTPHEVLLEE
jgi:hypothetical protein